MDLKVLDDLLLRRAGLRDVIKQYEQEVKEIDKELEDCWLSSQSADQPQLDSIHGSEWYFKLIKVTRHTIDRMSLLNYISADTINKCEKVSESQYIKCFPLKET